MELKKLVVDSKSTWIDFAGLEGFSVEVANLSRKELTGIRKKCTTTKFNRRSRVAEDVLDDEKFVTEEAYNNPKFVEDIIRDLALSLNKDERVSAYKIESENFESIHNHSAYAFIEKDKTKECVKGKDNVSFLKLSQLKSSCH